MRRLIFPIGVLFLAGCLNSSDRPPFKEKDIIEKQSGDYGCIYLQDYKLHNNVWGKEDVTEYSQELFTVSGRSGDGFGWRWDWPQTTRVLAYPEIIYGATPWQVSTNDQFPRKLNDNPVIVSYSLYKDITPSCNLALEFWLSEDDAPMMDEVTHEVMIWQINNGMVPAGKNVGSFSYRETEYQVFFNSNHHPGPGGGIIGNDYIAFVVEEEVLSAELNLSVFIDFLIQENFIDNPELYMLGIEFGTEILGGKGMVYFEDFSVNADPAKK